MPRQCPCEQVEGAVTAGNERDSVDAAKQKKQSGKKNNMSGKQRSTSKNRSKAEAQPPNQDEPEAVQGAAGAVPAGLVPAATDTATNDAASTGPGTCKSGAPRDAEAELRKIAGTARGPRDDRGPSVFGGEPGAGGDNSRAHLDRPLTPGLNLSQGSDVSIFNADGKPKKMKHPVLDTVDSLPVLRLCSNLFNWAYAMWKQFQRLPIRYRLQAVLYLWFYYLGAFMVAYVAGVAFALEKVKTWIVRSRVGRIIGEDILGRFWITEEKIPTLSAERKRRVLVTGAVHGKGLHTVRILARAGHTVIVADTKENR